MDKDPRKHEMVNMRRQGATLNAIGEKYGVSRERVRQIIGTEGKSEGRQAKFGPGLERAESFIQNNPEASWREVSEYAGLSERALQRLGVKKKSARGNFKRQWTKTTMIEAGVRWKIKMGRHPKTADWMRGSKGEHPTSVTIFRNFSSWEVFRSAVDQVIEAHQIQTKEKA